MGVSEEIDALLAKGLRHLNREEFEEAERVFRKLVKADPSPTSRNNLAVCRFRQGDPEGALKVLKPNLEADLPNPFAHALAAQALAVLGRQDDAEEHLARAISDFETGMETVVPAGLVDGQSWREYTVIIKRAATSQIVRTPLSVFMAGVHRDHQESRRGSGPPSPGPGPVS